MKTQLSVGTSSGSVEAHAALVLAYHQGHVLGFQSNHKPDGYGFPCGKINQGEAARAAAIRELEEETGIGIHQSILVFADIMKNDNGKNIAIYLYGIPRNQERPTPVPTKEGTGEWLKFADFVAKKSQYQDFNRRVMEQVNLL